jgi:hypothetical protein
VRETVEAVREVTVGDGVGGALERPQEVSLTLLAKKLGLDKNSAHHRVRKAIERGYLVNREEKRGKPARIAIADPLPDELEILPDPTVLECWSADGGVKGKEGDAIEPEKSDGAAPSLLPPVSLSNTPTPPTGPEVCAQCGVAEPGPLLDCLVTEGVVRLHHECRRFWLREHPQPKAAGGQS